jgi:hypothetical protein
MMRDPLVWLRDCGDCKFVLDGGSTMNGPCRNVSVASIQEFVDQLAAFDAEVKAEMMEAIRIDHRRALAITLGRAYSSCESSW